MKRLGFILAVVVTACTQPTTRMAPQDENLFVRLSEASEILTIVRNPNKGGVVYFDAYINSEFIIDEAAEYIFAPKFGIAISIPKDTEYTTGNWEFKNCNFMPSEHTARRTESHPKIFSFHSSCSNSSIYNNYILTSTGKIVAFEIFEKNKAGDKIKVVTFVAVK